MLAELNQLRRELQQAKTTKPNVSSHA